MGYSVYKDKVRYSEVDKMGRVYNSHYLTWFELGRTDYFKKKSLNYAQIEDERGLFLPVRESYIKYKYPLLYDEDYLVFTKCKIIDKYRIKFDYSIKNSQNKLSTIGYTFHVFIDKSGRIIEVPDFFVKAMES
ncbi:MAG: acyl-CoA thioesterase [Candidatus Muirbacterium halophilum]|nr:acyl-CoA thioesterase [Candidatus Muirbacterium halophilum]MCK9475466.1 acyl-CoA thioesterase [Candidatus Muirbacterium halophilum]